MLYLNIPAVKDQKEKLHEFNSDEFELLFEESPEDEFDKFSDLLLFLLFTFTGFCFELISDFFGIIKTKLSFSKD